MTKCGKSISRYVRLHQYFRAMTVIVAAVLLGLPADAAEEEHAIDMVAPPAHANARDPFDIDLPKDCRLESRNGPDFDVFYILCNDTQYGGIYVGNAPDTTIQPSRLIKTGLEFPADIQVWTVPVADDQARADAIAASVRARKPK